MLRNWYVALASGARCVQHAPCRLTGATSRQLHRIAPHRPDPSRPPKKRARRVELGLILGWFWLADRSGQFPDGEKVRVCVLAQFPRRRVACGPVPPALAILPSPTFHAVSASVHVLGKPAGTPLTCVEDQGAEEALLGWGQERVVHVSFWKPAHSCERLCLSA